MKQILLGIFLIKCPQGLCLYKENTSGNSAALLVLILIVSLGNQITLVQFRIWTGEYGSAFYIGSIEAAGWSLTQHHWEIPTCSLRHHLLSRAEMLTAWAREMLLLGFGTLLPTPPFTPRKITPVIGPRHFQF